MSSAASPTALPSPQPAEPGIFGTGHRVFAAQPQSQPAAKLANNSPESLMPKAGAPDAGKTISADPASPKPDSELIGAVTRPSATASRAAESTACQSPETSGAAALVGVKQLTSVPNVLLPPAAVAISPLPNPAVTAGLSLKADNAEITSMATHSVSMSNTDAPTPDECASSQAPIVQLVKQPACANAAPAPLPAFTEAPTDPLGPQQTPSASEAEPSSCNTKTFSMMPSSPDPAPQGLDRDAPATEASPDRHTIVPVQPTFQAAHQTTPTSAHAQAEEAPPGFTESRASQLLQRPGSSSWDSEELEVRQGLRHGKGKDIPQEAGRFWDVQRKTFHSHQVWSHDWFPGQGQEAR